MTWHRDPSKFKFPADLDSNKWLTVRFDYLALPLVWSLLYIDRSRVRDQSRKQIVKFSIFLHYLHRSTARRAFLACWVKRSFGSFFHEVTSRSIAESPCDTVGSWYTCIRGVDNDSEEEKTERNKLGVELDAYLSLNEASFCR